VSRRPTIRRFASAGALWAPAAFALLAILATPAALAQLDMRRKPVTEPPAGVAVPAGPPLDATAVRAPAPAAPGAKPTTGVIPLRMLAADSVLVVDGVVGTIDTFDAERLDVYRVRPQKTLRGSTDAAELAVVEMRNSTEVPAWLAGGDRAVLLLREAPPLSYLAQQLPTGTYYAPTGGRDGIVRVTSDAERETVAAVLAEGARIATLTDETENRTARRALAFRELGSDQPRLAGDAQLELRLLDPLKELTHDEIAALEHALASKNVRPATRVGLVQLIAQRGLTEALPAVKATLVDEPEVLDAVLAARVRLGAPAGRGELTGYLTSKDPKMRSSAVRALAGLPEPALGDIGHYATSDPDTGVRVAAIEALGSTQKAGALPTLSETFGTSQREIRQASGRAILAIGGDAASDALINLALHGADSQTQTYAAVLLLVSHGRDSPPVQRLLDSRPSPEVVDVVQKGLHWQHAHNQPQ
jgi:HEAT repeat protein